MTKQRSSEYDAVVRRSVVVSTVVLNASRPVQDRVVVALLNDTLAVGGAVTAWAFVALRWMR